MRVPRRRRAALAVAGRRVRRRGERHGRDGERQRRPQVVRGGGSARAEATVQVPAAGLQLLPVFLLLLMAEKNTLF